MTAPSISDEILAFKTLSDEETQAIKEFTLLWSFFEGQFLGESASTRKLSELVQLLFSVDSGILNDFEDNLDYLRSRYFENGEQTIHFEHLHLRTKDLPNLVRDVLSGKDRDPQNEILVMLIVVLRYRNNLFHGLKWQYRLQGQLDNFLHANSVLKKIIKWSSDVINN